MSLSGRAPDSGTRTKTQKSPKINLRTRFIARQDDLNLKCSSRRLAVGVLNWHLNSSCFLLMPLSLVPDCVLSF